MVLGVLMVFMVLAAGGAAAVSAQDEFFDPNPANDEATATVDAFVDPPADPINITIGANSSILDPSQSQTQDQASAQSQTSDNSNSNSLTNANTNIATSTSSATNTNIISNDNTFNPVFVVSNGNYIG